MNIITSGAPMASEAAIAAQRQRFQTLLESHRRIVFKVAGSYCWHPEDRADLAQEIATQLWRAFPAYDATRTFSTWMYRIALNVAISFVRGHTLREAHLEPLSEQHAAQAAPEESTIEDQQRLRALARFMAGLDAFNRGLLLLYLDQHSYREIADILGITETNVATKISRLKQRLRQDLAPAGATP